MYSSYDNNKQEEWCNKTTHDSCKNLCEICDKYVTVDR